MKKSSYQNALGFYEKLVKFMAQEKYSEEKMWELINLNVKLRGDVSLKLSKKTLIEVHLDQPRSDEYLMVTEEWSECIFRDLLPHLREPRARLVISQYCKLVGLEETDLYVHIRGLRLLGKNDNGPVVVTLVVSSGTVFLDFLSRPNNSNVQKVHLTYEEKVNS